MQRTVEGKILKVRICLVFYAYCICECFSCHGFGGVFNLGWWFLQIRALTELCLFTEAVKEAVQLTQGVGVLLPHGYYIAKDTLQV